MSATQAEVWDLLRALIESQKETDRKFQETDRKSQETDRRIKEVSAQIGRLGNRLGDFVEEMVRPALVRIFQERGLGVHQVLRDLTSYNDQGKMQSQVDLLAINSDIAIVVECKSRLSMDDVNDHLQRLDAFKTNFRQYATFRIQGAVAAVVLPENVSEYAARKGLYVLAQSGDAVTIHNEVEFQPQQW